MHDVGVNYQERGVQCKPELDTFYNLTKGGVN